MHLSGLSVMRPRGIQTQPANPTQILVALAAIVVVAAGMKAAASLLIPFLLAGFITVICLPVLNGLKRRGVPAWLAISLILTGLLVGGYLLVVLLSASLDGFLSRLPRYERRLEGLLDEWRPQLISLGIDADWLELPDVLEPGTLMGLLGNLAGAIRTMLSHGLVVFLTVVFMLLEAHSLPRRVRSIARDPDRTEAVLSGFILDLNRYLGIKALTSLATGILVGLWLWWFKVDFALLWGVLAFLLNFIPTIGSLVAAVPGILVALIQHGSGTALWVAAGYLLINQLIGSLIEPKVLGDRLGLSALVVFVSLVFWGWILGPAGMFLAVPLSMMLKLALASHPATAPIAILISSQPDQQPAERVPAD
jgi:AI-2 transport protein TqsA